MLILKINKKVSLGLRLCILITIFTVTPNLSNAQAINKTIYSDTSVVGSDNTYDAKGEVLEKYYYIYGKNLPGEHWQVYYDSNFTKILLDYYCDNDSCITLQYFSNGKLERKEVGTIQGQYVYEEIWCENGQLVRKVDFMQQPNHIVNYYCNGVKKNEFNRIAGFIKGDYKWWYNNGQIRLEGLYGDMGTEDGTWKYFSDEGTLLKEEIWEKGVLKETKEY
ncbi:MAG: hypothetical protein KDD41_03975 [Flavobacteriales bacterium]|nr:hypothetical protein [Flavobacteriales bacterium]